MLEAIGTNATNVSSAGAARQAALAVAAKPQQQLERPKAPVAPFISPRIRVDNDLNMALIEFRDGETGDVERQYPTKQQIQAFQRADAIAQEQSSVETAETPAATPQQSQQSFAAVEAPAPAQSTASESSTTSVIA